MQRDRMLRTARLTLEPLTVDHADLLYEGLRDPALYTFIPADPPASLEEKRAHFARIMRGPRDNPNELWRNWAVKITASGHYAGMIETSVFPGDYAYLAYFIFSDAQRNAYAKEACQTVLPHVAREYGVKTIVAEMDTRNTASWRLMESLGFTRVSEKRDADFFKGATSHEYRYHLDLSAPTK
jgi:[ribosomal protein S5]-alanine N-acetyltransferase